MGMFCSRRSCIRLLNLVQLDIDAFPHCILAFLTYIYQEFGSSKIFFFQKRTVQTRISLRSAVQDRNKYNNNQKGERTNTTNQATTAGQLNNETAAARLKSFSQTQC
jgi:hypothetical protein